MSALVAGVDFGTLSVRVSLVDSERGPIGAGTAEYPLHRKKEDPDFATQRHADHMDALVLAMRKALATAGVKGGQGAAVALGTPGGRVGSGGKGVGWRGGYFFCGGHRACGGGGQMLEE